MEITESMAIWQDNYAQKKGKVPILSIFTGTGIKNMPVPDDPSCDTPFLVRG